MHTSLMSLIQAEVFQLRKRTATWVLLGIWVLLAVFFGYVLPYLTDINTDSRALQMLLPQNMVENMITGFPFYGGAISLMLGVLAVGSEYNWGTFKTMFTQRPGRSQIVIAKIAAIAIVLIPFVVAVFAVGAISSVIIANVESAAIAWPALMDLVSSMLAGWMILFTWAAVGVLLATCTRGTSLAIGIGIMYALVIEGLVSAFATSIDWMEPLVNGFLRANAYSLVEPFVSAGNTESREGPGTFSGPYVGATQAFIVLLIWSALSLGCSWWMLRTRDID